MGVVEWSAAGLVAMVGVLTVVEAIRPARSFEEVPGWRRKCLRFASVVVAISVAIPFVLEPWIVDARWLPGHKLGLWGGAAVGIASSELLVYWVHRLHHRVTWLWRWVHQLHHSAERVDVYGAAYFHPFEIAEGTIVGMLFFSVVLGLSPEAAGLSILWQAFAGIFQHANIRTPPWLGYLIQRPEQHAVHHERGHAGANYANLPIWDLVFGTFQNPRAWAGVAGFYSGASSRTWQMLLGKDISRGETL